ncbi:MAG: sulfatase-like hydrolase/transferase [bacterium]|nr:sulfatase-like hydrolase/transferase [bacterium]
MKRQIGWFRFGLAMTCLAVMVQAAPPAMAEEDGARPNVVLIVLDTLRADRLTAERNGIPLMPNLRRFSEESLDFAHAVSPCSWTRPAMASLFTSLYVDTHGVHYSEDAEDPTVKSHAVPESMQTMASYLKRAGYATAGIQTNAHAHGDLGFAQGFDSYEFKSDAKADWVTARALEIAKEAESAKEPYFLYAHYLDPHDKYAPPERYRSQLGCPEKLDETDTQWATDLFTCVLDKGHHMVGLKEKRDVADASPVGMEAVRTLYDGEVKFLDDELGKLLAYLDEHRENTIVVIVTDHGEEFWDHGFLMHSLTLYEEQIHVPLIVRGPGLEPRLVEETVETLDVLPTVADLLGLAPNPLWQGLSLLADGRDAQRPAFSSTRTLWPKYKIHVEQVQLDNWKLIVDRTSGGEMLFDLGADPGEAVNLSEKHPARVLELRALLERHNQRNAAHAEMVERPEEVSVDEELKEQLRALGYF